MPSRRPLITLLTDFGTRDGFVAELKGRLLTACPQAVLVDVSHDIPRFAVAEAARVLGQIWKAFPPGTLHLAIVDPGVGGPRLALALEAGGHRFIGPDNGLFTLPVQADPRHRAYALAVPANATPTFHGRDVFAPATARLALGAKPSDLGPRVPSVVLLPDLHPTPLPKNRGWRGKVLACDAFGNLLTNLPGHLLARRERSYVLLGRRRITLWTRTYGEAPSGRPAILVNSQGNLEIFLREASATEKLQVRPGTPVTWLFSRPG